MADRNWQKDIQPLIKKYKGKKFPLNYGNTYELVVMVILAAQDSDAHINKVAPDLFKAFPDMKSLATATRLARVFQRGLEGGGLVPYHDCSL